MKKYIGIYTDASLEEVQTALDGVAFTLLVNEFALIPTENDEFFQEKIDSKIMVVWGFDFDDSSITYEEFKEGILPRLSYELDTVCAVSLCEFYELGVLQTPRTK